MEGGDREIEGVNKKVTHDQSKEEKRKKENTEEIMTEQQKKQVQLMRGISVFPQQELNATTPSTFGRIIFFLSRFNSFLISIISF